jgi:hypothetical protein
MNNRRSNYLATNAAILARLIEDQQNDELYPGVLRACQMALAIVIAKEIVKRNYAQLDEDKFRRAIIEEAWSKYRGGLSSFNDFSTICMDVLLGFPKDGRIKNI